jgi:hypothetical protein
MTSSNAHTPPPSHRPARPLAERLEPTTLAIGAAHDAFLRDALEGVRWERRGLLGRLTRS